MTEPTRAVVAGHSNLTYSDEGPEFSFMRLLHHALVEADPAREWECIPVRTRMGRTLAPDLDRIATEIHPDVVVVALTATGFAQEFVTTRIRRRWGRAYNLALKATRWLKHSTSITEPGFRPRHLLYRIPEEIAFFLIGGEAGITVERAIEDARDAIETMVRHEDVVTICRLPGATAHIPARRFRRYKQRIDAFNTAVSEICRSRHVGHFDIDSELAAANRKATHGKDGIHFDLEMRRFEAGVTALAIVKQLELVPAAGAAV
jgi:hypothetical protein